MSTSASRRSVARILSGVMPGTVTPGEPASVKRQAVGWGYVGLPVASVADVLNATFSFVYRSLNRLRAGKDFD